MVLLSLVLILILILWYNLIYGSYPHNFIEFELGWDKKNWRNKDKEIKHLKIICTTIAIHSFSEWGFEVLK